MKDKGKKIVTSPHITLEKQEVGLICDSNLRPETEQTFNYSDSAAIGQAT